MELAASRCGGALEEFCAEREGNRIEISKSGQARAGRILRTTMRMNMTIPAYRKTTNVGLYRRTLDSVG